jgi:tRNA-specific 2-thiouridylase
VLSVLSQEQLRHALFPLGEYTKPEVRAMAAERGLAVATKAESQEICFVAANDYRGFMRRYADSTGRASPQSGPILDESGAQLGNHDGLAYYTIGQRKGLGVSAREPLHVLRMDQARNALVVGPAARLDTTEFTVRGMSWTSGVAPTARFDALVKARYKAAPIPATITPLDAGRVHVRCAQPLRAVTPGQGAVLYGGAEGDEALGSGLIEGADATQTGEVDFAGAGTAGA